MVDWSAARSVHLLESLPILANNEANVEDRCAVRILSRPVPRSLHVEQQEFDFIETSHGSRTLRSAARSRKYIEQVILPFIARLSTLFSIVTPSYLKHPCNNESFALANAIRVVYEYATGCRLNPTLPKRSADFSQTNRTAVDRTNLRL